MILDEILNHKKTEVAQRKAEMPLRELKSRVWDAPAALGFAKRLNRSDSGMPAVIAEVKKASPSAGVIRPDFDPESIARSYQAAGASAISVLTNEKFFQGSLAYLREVKKAVTLPVLRKDFIIDEYQIYEARVAGADAVLLIVSALESDELAHLMNRAAEIDLDCLVEVHDEAEMAVAVEVGAPVIGINNRNLQTFEVSLDTTQRLLPMIPRAKKVSESGIHSREDMKRLGSMGVDAVLIGEALMRQDDIEDKLRELIG